MTLAELRKSRGKTQEEVGAALGVSQVTVSHIERCDVHLSTLKRYLKALGAECEITIRFGDDGRFLKLDMAAVKP